MSYKSNLIGIKYGCCRLPPLVGEIIASCWSATFHLKLSSPPDSKVLTQHYLLTSVGFCSSELYSKVDSILHQANDKKETTNYLPCHFQAGMSGPCVPVCLMTYDTLPTPQNSHHQQ